MVDVNVRGGLPASTTAAVGQDRIGSGYRSGVFASPDLSLRAVYAVGTAGPVPGVLPSPNDWT
ncbi:hypothetical protein [Streptomyces showdoensis]|uniref:hypothetical protein n=1 Tax=Streptomyces showdoensis TaxID=68268 RepID=UPI0031E7A67E